MTLALLSLTFQGEPTVEGALDPETLREAQREAFPRSPRRDALSDPNYCAYKLAPLRNGFAAFSVVRNRGATDAHGRPALEAVAVVVDKAGLASSRDPIALWKALSGWTRGQSSESLLAAAAKESCWENEEVFRGLQAALSSEGPFHAGLAAVLASGKATIGSAAEGLLDTLRPAMSLLPAARLLQLELASGSIDAEGREGVLAIAQPMEVTEPVAASGGLLGLLKRRPAAAVADLRLKRASLERPQELVKAIAETKDWPGISARDRFRALMGGLDAAGSPFDVSPPLQAMRETVRQVEKLAHDLEGWR